MLSRSTTPTRQAQKWERAAAALAQQRDGHQSEQEKQQAVVAAAEAHAEQVHAEVVAPLLEQATGDGVEAITAQARMLEASAARRGADGLRRRAAERTLTLAVEEHRTIEKATRKRWGSVPQSSAGVQPWAEVVAQTQADADPRVVEAHRQAERARTEQMQLSDQRQRERTQLRPRVLGVQPHSTPETHAIQWHRRADRTRRELTEVESLPIDQAAQLGAVLPVASGRTFRGSRLSSSSTSGLAPWTRTSIATCG